MKTEMKRNAAPDCLWTQAGVVSKKACHTDFFCNTCRFDRAMNRVCQANEAARQAGIKNSRRSARFVFWKDSLMKRPLARRPCIHHMKGHIGFKNCTKSYHCVDCEFDQYFQDQFKVHTVLKPVGFSDIGGVSLPTGYYLHPGHTWVKIEGQDVVRVGIDDFAARLLGKFDTFKAPLMGRKVEQGRPAIPLARQGKPVCFLSPVTGVITDINPLVRKSPELISSTPYTDGWIYMLFCPNLKQDLKHLMFMDSCSRFMEDKVDALYGFIEAKTALKAADGGSLAPDIYGNLPGISWEDLIERFIPQGS